MTDIILLRLATVLTNDEENIYILTDFPLNSARLHEPHTDRVVVEYFLAKYPQEGWMPAFRPWPGTDA